MAALPGDPDTPLGPGAKPGRHVTDIDGARESIRAEAGLHDVRIHDIRHSFASRALALAFGEGLPIIGRLLGHRRVETIARYAHLARDSVRESAARIAVIITAEVLWTLQSGWHGSATYAAFRVWSASPNCLSQLAKDNIAR